MSQENRAGSGLERHRPLSPELIQHQATELVLGLGKQIRLIRYEGSIPGPAPYELQCNPLKPSQTAKERIYEVGTSHEIFMKALKDPRLSDELVTPEFDFQPLIDWEMGRLPVRTLFTRISRDMALMEHVYVNDNYDPLQIRPQIWVGRDAIVDFLQYEFYEKQPLIEEAA